MSDPSIRCKFIKTNGQRCKNRTKKGYYCFCHTEKEFGLWVKKSQIPNAGWGLWATKDFPRDEKIVEYKGKLISNEEANRMAATNGNILQINRNFNIDANPSTIGLGQFSNDAAGLTRVPGLRNNAKIVGNPREKRAFLETSQPIKATPKHPTEIFTSYGRGYWAGVRRNLRNANN